MAGRGFLTAALGLACTLVTVAAAQSQTITYDHDVPVDLMVGDQFTWRDASNQPRVIVLTHNTGQVGPGGTRGGELWQYKYQVGAATRTVGSTHEYAGGFGYVVSHPEGGETCMGGPIDSSSLGHFWTGTFTRVFEGRHHAIFRFTQSYPRYCSTVGVPGAPILLPVTLDWVVATGRDNPLLAITWDLSGVAVNTLNDDSRGPYGELLFDGSAPGAHSAVAGVGWGDRYKFTSTASPVTLNSGWTWNVANTVPYVKLWTTAPDATMGTVLTQTISQQDAGGYWGTGRWNSTSAGGGSACPVDDGVAHTMPCTFNWPYQSINYSFYDDMGNLLVDDATNNTRLAWGTNFGFLGQSSYLRHGSMYYGGPLPDLALSGWPRKSYTTAVVLGQHTLDPVGTAVTQIETVQNTALTAAIGAVVTSGPGGANRTDAVAYAPAGWNHVYGAWALQAAGNNVDANFDVTAGTLRHPVLIVSSWTGGLPASVKLNGATLVQDTDYFPSPRAAASELWVTLNRDLAGAANHVEISAPATGSDAVTVYRLRHPSIGAYLFTIYPSERDAAQSQYGYIYEGVCCNWLGAPAGDGRTPLYRLYGAAAGEYFFTSSAAERDGAVSQYGYVYEGVAAYCHPTGNAAAPTPWFRLRYANKHFYTIYASERDAAVSQYGYTYEGVACYVPAP